DMVREFEALEVYLAARARLPWPLRSVTSVEECAAAVVKALVRRPRRVYVPRAVALVRPLRVVTGGRLVGWVSARATGGGRRGARGAGGLPGGPGAPAGAAAVGGLGGGVRRRGGEGAGAAAAAGVRAAGGGAGPAAAGAHRRPAGGLGDRPGHRGRAAGDAAGRTGPGVACHRSEPWPVNRRCTWSGGVADRGCCWCTASGTAGRRGSRSWTCWPRTTT